MKSFNYIIKSFKHILFIFLAISIIFFTFVLYLDISECLDKTNIISKEVLEKANDNIMSNDVCNNSYKKNKCIFGLFSDFFEKSSNNNKYYPSYFVKYDTTYEYNNTYLPDYVIDYINKTEALKQDLISIAVECSSILKYYSLS